MYTSYDRIELYIRRCDVLCSHVYEASALGPGQSEENASNEPHTSLQGETTPIGPAERG
jgi:hypothetical protein